ncbi:hypothetical protein Tco_1021503, partial [Tanacetum coccineum]
DVEPEPNLPLQEIIILDPDDQPMWENAKIVAPTPNSAIVQPNVDDNFVINSTHLKMIHENKFDGYLRADPHDHIREFLAIRDMFKYGETQSEAVKLLIFPFSFSEKLLTELNNDVKNDLEDFKRYIRSMRTVQDKLYDSDDHKTTGVLPYKKYKTVKHKPQSKTDLEKSITKFLDGQRVTNMFFKDNVNDMILKMKQNEKNFQTKIKNMERKIDEWEKSQNIYSEQTGRTDPPPPPQAHTEHVNVVFTGSGKSDDSLKITKDPPPLIIINNKIEKDKPIKTSRKGYHVVKTEEYPFCTDIAKISRKRSKPDNHGHGKGKRIQRARRMRSKVNKSQLMVNSGQPQKDKNLKFPNQSLKENQIVKIIPKP